MGAVDCSPCVVLIEFADIPIGIRTLDALTKEAEVVVAASGTVQCGHYMILFGGDVEPVQFAYERALSVSGASVVDKVLLPNAEPRLVPSILEATLRWPAPGDTLAVLQTGSSPTMLGAVDAALKGAEVELVELRIAEGLAGKAIASLWGELVDVEAAVSIANDAIAQGSGIDCQVSIIARADQSVVRAVCGGTRFFQEWRG